MDQSESLHNTVVKFTGENWVTWKFQIQIILKSKGLFDVVTGQDKRPEEATTNWDRKDAKAQEIIVTRLEEKPLLLIISCKNAEEMWSKLTSIYEHKSQVSVHLLQQKFFSLEQGQDSIAQFISKLEDIKCQLKALGEEISDNMIITKVLMSLPESLKHFISAWESSAADKQTLSDLTSTLLIEEERIQKNETSTALSSKSGRASHNAVKCFSCGKLGHVKKNCPKVKQNENRSRKCLYCKKDGHDVKDCFFKKNKDKSKKEDESSSSNAFLSLLEVRDAKEVAMLVGEAKLLNDDWCMDSGASDHMCFDISQFKSVKTDGVDRVVKLGNGSEIKVRGVGQIELQAWNGEKFIDTTMNEVLYVPELKLNLFSVSKVLDKGFKMYSDKNTCKLIDNYGVGNERISKRKGKLFQMSFRHKKVSQACFGNADKKHSLEIWHQKFVHLNFDEVKRILKKNNIEYEKKEKIVCRDCLKGKQHRLKFKISKSRASKSGELLHVDLCGPFEVTSLGGPKYFLLIKDDFSIYRFVHFLKQKSETCDRLKKSIRLIEKQT